MWSPPIRPHRSEILNKGVFRLVMCFFPRCVRSIRWPDRLDRSEYFGRLVSLCLSLSRAPAPACSLCLLPPPVYFPVLLPLPSPALAFSPPPPAPPSFPAVQLAAPLIPPFFCATGCGEVSPRLLAGLRCIVRELWSEDVLRREFGVKIIGKQEEC